MTHEQKTALDDVVINIITPILGWLHLYEADPTIDIRCKLKEICLESERKVREFKCDNNCFYGAICREYNKGLRGS